MRRAIAVLLLVEVTLVLQILLFSHSPFAGPWWDELILALPPVGLIVGFYRSRASPSS